MGEQRLLSHCSGGSYLFGFSQLLAATHITIKLVRFCVSGQ
jgi:hypothetical protein